MLPNEICLVSFSYNHRSIDLKLDIEISQI